MKVMDIVASNALERIKISRNCLNLHHIFFADDLLLFVQASVKNVQVRKEILEYCWALGQGINEDKSSLYFSKIFERGTMGTVEQALRIKEVDDPGKYFDLPTIWGNSKRETLSFIKNYIHAKLQGWGNLILNPISRLLLPTCDTSTTNSLNITFHVWTIKLFLLDTQGFRNPEIIH